MFKNYRINRGKIGWILRRMIREARVAEFKQQQGARPERRPLRRQDGRKSAHAGYYDRDVVGLLGSACPLLCGGDQIIDQRVGSDFS